MISKNTQFESIEYGHPELCRCKRCKWNGHKKEKYKDEIKINLRIEPSMIITPVSQSEKSNSRRDWMEQEQRRKVGQKHVWDDSKLNYALKGDLFAYVENSVKGRDGQKTYGWIQVFIILNVCSPKERLPSWSDNVGQSDRNVIELSQEPIYTGTMVEWKEHMGYAERYCVQGTIHLNYPKISDYIGMFISTSLHKSE